MNQTGHKEMPELLDLLESTFRSGNIGVNEYEEMKGTLSFQAIALKYSDNPYAIKLGGRTTSTDEVFAFLESLNPTVERNNDQQR